MKEFDGIDFLKNAKNVGIVTGGHSGAKTYSAEVEGKKYFIKFLTHDNYQFENDLEEIFSSAGVAHAKIIERGFNKAGQKFIIEEFLNCPRYDKVLDELLIKYIYEHGIKMGLAIGRAGKNPIVKKAKREGDFSHEWDFIKRYLSSFVEIEKSQNISQENKKYLCNLKKIVEKGLPVLEKPDLIFTLSDFKPSNFMFENRQVLAVDFEHCGIREVARSVLWGIVSWDVDKPQKFFTFLNGYLDGLYAFSVPKRVYKKISLMFYLMVIRQTWHMIDGKEDGTTINKVLDAYRLKYAPDPKFNISSILNYGFNRKEISFLKGCEIDFMSGSYSPLNLVFSVRKKEEKFFLKLIALKDTAKIFKRNYNILTKLAIPTPKLIDSGILSNGREYVLTEYLDGEDLEKTKRLVDFQSGQEIGISLAKQMKKLKEYDGKSFEKYVADDFLKRVLKEIDFIYENDLDLASKYIGCSSDKLKTRVRDLIKAFEKEPIGIIHFDLKIGNTLLKDGLRYIIDIENFVRSYDTFNFLWVMFPLYSDEASQLYRGYVSAYLKEMNGGKIPIQVHKQMKLILFSFMTAYAARVVKKEGEEKKLKLFKVVLDEFFSDKPVEWLI